MNILQIADTEVWAIGKLSKSIVKHNPHLNFRTIYVHPKHTEKHLDEVRAHIEWADVIDFQYWNTARQLLEQIPELRSKPSLLSHHNEKDLLGADWNELGIDLHIVETKRSMSIMQDKYKDKLKLIPLAIDLHAFTYQPKLPNTKTVGYAGRVVPWKGLREVARACYELGYTLKFMGKFDKPDYWASIPPEHQAIIDMEFMNCDDSDRQAFYHCLDVFVYNSNAGRETGTLPFMESMACGVPTVSTRAGIANDIIDSHENGVLIEFEDYESLKFNLQALMENDELKESVRQNGWNTIKNFTEEQRAWEYGKVYNKLQHPTEKLVSIVVPVYNSADNLRLILNSLQLGLEYYRNIEVIVADDVSDDNKHGTIADARAVVDYPIKYVNTTGTSATYYGLAIARNLAVVEAQGYYLMFNDSRMQPQPTAVAEFVTKMQDYNDKKVWLFGEKGANKTSFVENFSFIRRDDFIRAGMCNERVNKYGAMSQELRARFKYQGFEMVYTPQAQATVLGGSHKNLQRRADIIDSKVMLWKLNLNG